MLPINDILNNLFGNNEPAQQQPPANQQQQQDPSKANHPNNLEHGGDPSQGNPNQQQQQQQSGPNQQQQQQQQANENDPLAIYAGLFDNTQKDGEQEDAVPTFALSPDKLQEVAGSLDFTKGVDAELLQKLSEGDLTVLPALLNHVGQQAYSQALSHGTALTDKFVGQYSEHQMKQVAPLVRDQLTQNALADATGEQTIDLSNPVVQKAVKQTATMLQQQNPTLPPSKIAEMAKKYHIELAATMLGANGDALAQLPTAHKQQQQQQQAATTDWDEYLT